MLPVNIPDWFLPDSCGRVVVSCVLLCNAGCMVVCFCVWSCGCVLLCNGTPVLVWWGHATEASKRHPQTRNQLQTGFSDASSNAYAAKLTTLLMINIKVCNIVFWKNSNALFQLNYQQTIKLISITGVSQIRFMASKVFQINYRSNSFDIDFMQFVKY